MYDIKITGGTIIDGTGAPGYAGDVGIKDGKVVALGKADGDARRVIDAKGKAVTPGFVDGHTHYDAQVLWDRMTSISPWHGVTSVVMGNCGFGVAPTRPAHRDRILETLMVVEGMSFEAMKAGVGDDWPFESFPEYLDVVDRQGTAINVAVLLGHTPLRLYVMGEAAVEREASEDELAAMQALMAEAMEAGALGFATSHSTVHWGYGGKPVPSRLSTNDEIALLGREVGKRGGSIQVNYGVEPIDLDLLADIQEKTGAPLSWTALLADLWGPAACRPLLDKTAELIAQGRMVVPQVTNRPIFFEFDYENPLTFEMLPVVNALAKGTREERLAALATPEFRQDFRDQLLPYQRGWEERAVISHNPLDPSENERSLVEVAAEHGKDAIDYSIDLALATDLESRVRAEMVNYSESEVRQLLTDENTVLGLSDAGAHTSQLCDACQATDLLAKWVREKKVLSLEEAIRMLTSRPAQVYGLHDRGLLAEGRPADVVVLDPDTVAAGPLKRVHDQPAGAVRLISEAIGIEAVIVNGTLIREGGRDVVGDGALPGKVLRGGRAG